MLYEDAIEMGVEVRLSCRIQNIDQNAPAVELVDGERIEGDIIIGADGEQGVPIYTKETLAHFCYEQELSQPFDQSC